MTNQPIKCIQCGRIKAVQPMGGNCKIEFDPVDDSDIGYGNPERYASRKEEYELRQRGRKYRCR